MTPSSIDYTIKSIGVSERDFWPRGVVLVTVTGVVLGLIVWLSALKYGFLLPAVLLAAWYGVWSFRRPAWALATIMLLYLYLLEKTEGITLFEVIFGCYFYGYLAVWVFKKCMLARARILTSATDLLLISFFLVSFLSVLVLVADAGSPFLWLKEFLTITGLVLYFPARDAMRNDRDMKVIVVGFALMVGIVAAYNLFQYRSRSLLATYVWEILGSRKAYGSHLFVAVSLAAASLFVHLEKMKHRLVMFMLLLYAGLALAVTFSRGFWLGAILGLVVLFLLVDHKEKTRLLFTGMAVTLTAGIVLTLYAGNLGDVVMKALAARFVSAGNPLEDLSVAERLAESRKVLSVIAENPIIGHGYGAQFSHYNIIEKMTMTSMYVHNALFYSMLKVGILGTILFFGFYGMILWRAIRLSGSGTLNRLNLAMIRAAIGVLIGFLLIGTNSGIFIDRSALLVVTLCAALIESKADSTGFERI